MKTFPSQNIFLCVVRNVESCSFEKKECVTIGSGLQALFSDQVLKKYLHKQYLSS